MRFVRAAGFGLLAAFLPMVGVGCASVSPKVNVLSSLARHRAESQYQAARNAEERGQLDKARELYAALQRRSPNTPEYAHRMGVVCAQLQDYQTAGKFFEHARSLDSQNPQLLADMGYSSYLQRDYASAEALLSESVAIRPGDTRAVNNLAMAIGYQGRYDEALALFRGVNSETQSLLNLAFVQYQKNESAVAMATYQRVLAQEPGNKVANSALQQLHASATRSPLASQAAELVAQSETVGSETPQAVQATQVSESVVEALPEQPRVLTVEELPSPRGPDSGSPLILPQGGAWSASGSAGWADENQLVEASGEFELPMPPAPPAELPADQESDAAIQSAVAAAPAAASSDDLTTVFSEGDSSPESATAESEDLTGLDWAKDDLDRQKAAAQSGNAANLPTDFFRGYCPVTLRDGRRLAIASGEFLAEYQSRVYQFSSAECRDAFLAHPEWYVPVSAGMDVVQVTIGNPGAAGSLDHACWYRRRLHLFSSAENLAAFRAAPRDFQAAAH